MTYSTGYMSVNDGITLIAMLMLPQVFLSEPSIAIGFVGSSAWLLKAVSGVLMMGLLLSIVSFYQAYIKQFHDGKPVPFGVFVNGTIGVRGARVLLLVWTAIFEVQTILTLREFADHTLITALQSSNLLLIILLFSLSMTFILSRGLEVIMRTAYLFFLVAAFGVVITALGLYNAYDVNNLLPWRGFGLVNLGEHSILDIGSWSFGLAVLCIAPSLQDIRTLRRSVILGVSYTILLKAMMIASIIMVFNIVVAPERALLFYEVVQAINLSQYLQRVDSIFILIWMTGGLISMVLMQFFAIDLFCQTFGIKDERPLIRLMPLVSAVVAIVPSSVGSAIQISAFFIYRVASVCTIVTLVVLAAGYFLKYRRGSTCVGDTKS